jgi:branched-chain amino acid transport system permease protein
MGKSYIILAVVLNGVSFAMLLFLLAAGLELMFGVMNIINLAHGSFYMIGAYIGVYLVQVTGNFVLGILAGMTSSLLVGNLSQPRILMAMVGSSRFGYACSLGILFGLILLAVSTQKMSLDTSSPIPFY